MVSIFTNLAAYSAQGNIQTASDAATSSIARLSSGQRIVKASDDVAGLSVGTILATATTTLKQALANTGQGSSLLQVADGALAQISTILARQKAIATQANSGTLSDTDRSYLNQEFQALTAQIDQIASATTFSSVRLLDGTLSGAQAVSTSTATGTTAANAANVTTAGAVVTIAGALTAGDTVTINGVTVTFAAAASGVGTTASAGKVIIGAGVTQTAQNLVAFLNNSTDARLANLQFTNAAGVISAVYTGGSLNGSYVVSAATTGANVTIASAANRTIATSANNLDGIGYGKTVAIGTVTGSLLTNGDTTATNAGPAINTQAVLNNADFIGKLGEGGMGEITGIYNGTANTAVFSLKVGDIIYTTAAIDTSAAAAPIALLFTGKNATGSLDGGTFTINLRGGGLSFGSQGQLDPLIAQINAGLSDVTFLQNRDVNSFTPGATVSVDGVLAGTLQGASANLRSENFNNITLEDFQIVAPTNGESDAVFTAVINGETYRSPAGQGNQIATNTSITLQSVTNPNHAFTLQTGNTPIITGGTTALDLSSQANADAVAKAVREAFGLTGDHAAVNLQVGARSTDTVGIQINSVASKNLFQNQALDITTIKGAQEASAAMDVAAQKINATRATVGALQSRLNFTASNLQSSISNQDAARSVLLDTDVSSESTKYATSQVLQQAGIAVLAQANQVTQQLLKLLQ